MTHRISLLVAGLFGLTAFGHADVTFGGTRSQGMGGAGLALPYDIGNNYRMNPAFLAFGSKSPTLQFPQLGYKLDGLTFGNISDIVGKATNGGVDSSGVLTLATQYATRPIALALNTNVGVRFAGLAIGAKGEVGLNSEPNQQLQNWAASGANINNVDLGSRLDVYGFGYQQVEVGYGNSVHTKAGRLALGFNTKTIKGYYAHKFADKDTIQNNNTNGVQNGSGLASDFAETNSYGMDIGAVYSPKGNDNLFFGLTVDNFVEPGIAFPYEAPGGGQPIIAGGFDPFRRAVNIGVGFQKSNFTLAADIIDLGNHAGRADTRAGAELAITKGFILRAGYNTRTAFSYGVSLGGLNIQVGGNAPLTLGSVIKF